MNSSIERDCFMFDWVPVSRLKEIQDVIDSHMGCVVKDKRFSFFDNIPLYGENYKWISAAKTYFMAVSDFVPSLFDFTNSEMRVDANLTYKPKNGDDIDRLLDALASEMACNSDARASTAREWLESCLMEFALNHGPMMGRFVAITDSEYNALLKYRTAKNDMEVTIQKVVNWPTWYDGEPIEYGQVAESLRGPARITGVEVSDGGWTLHGHLVSDEQGNGAPTRIVIDEGKDGQHPTREGEIVL